MSTKPFLVSCSGLIVLPPQSNHTSQPLMSSSSAYLHPSPPSPLNFHVSPCRRQPICRLPQHPNNSPATTVTRRQTLQSLSVISLYLLPTSSLADTDTDTEITFTKLPCDSPDCRPVEIHDYRIGTGKPAENGSRITVKWTGRLANRYGWPIQKEDADQVSFLLGTDNLIRGFEIAIHGMREGGKRRMIIPAEFGYLDEKSGPLPASYGDRRRLFATVLNPRRFKRAGDLVIDVQLLKVRPPR